MNNGGGHEVPVEVLNSKSTNYNKTKKVHKKQKGKRRLGLPPKKPSFNGGSSTVLLLWFRFNKSVGTGLPHNICFIFYREPRN